MIGYWSHECINWYPWVVSSITQAQPSFVRAQHLEPLPLFKGPEINILARPLWYYPWVPMDSPGPCGSLVAGETGENLADASETGKL